MHFEGKKYIYHFISIDTQMLIDTYIPPYPMHTLSSTTLPHIRQRCMCRFPLDGLWKLSSICNQQRVPDASSSSIATGHEGCLAVLGTTNITYTVTAKYETKIVMWVTWMEMLISCGKLIYTYKYWVRRSKSITSLDVAPWTPSLKSCDMNWSKAKNKYQIVKP